MQAAFRDAQASFEVLRKLYDEQSISSFHAAATTTTTAGDFSGGANLNPSTTPSWEFYAAAAEEPVPTYRVERAKSGRSTCAVKKTYIAKDNFRVGWINTESGKYGGWKNLDCWRGACATARESTPPLFFLWLRPRAHC